MAGKGLIMQGPSNNCKFTNKGSLTKDRPRCQGNQLHHNSSLSTPSKNTGWPKKTIT